MRTRTRTRGFSVVIAGMLVTMASPVGGAQAPGVPATNPGTTYADLVVAWRDANGVPLLQPYEVEGETGPTMEYCVQPVSSIPLPGMTAADRVLNEADGRMVYRIPLMGDLDPVAALAEDDTEDEVEVCDPQPAYAMYVAEAELERLNLVRQPDEVQQRKLADVATKLLTADRIALDAAGRITVDGSALDAAPEYAAIFASIMATGTIPGLDAVPAQIEGFDAWMLAAVAVGTAASKGVPLTIDSIEYYNRIAGVADQYEDTSALDVQFLQTTPPLGERFVDYRGFSYRRDDVFQGCVTWLDVPTLTWRVDEIADVVEFGELPPVAGVGGVVANVAGFTQLADDARAMILYLHEHEVIPGFRIDPVQTTTCDAQRDALSNPAVEWGGLPTELIQTDTVDATMSLYMPWAGVELAAAQLRVGIATTDPAQPFSDGTEVQMTAVDGLHAGDSILFAADGGRLTGTWDPTLPVVPGTGETTTFELTVAGDAPVATYELTLELVDGVDVLAVDTASVAVLDDVLTVLWTEVVDYAAQGTYTPVTARIVNPIGQPEASDARVRMTIDAPEDFTLATQVAAWSEAVGMAFQLDSAGDLVGDWDLALPLPAGYDESITWYLNAAEGAPIGLYTVTIELVDTGDAVLSGDTFEYIVAEASEHGGAGGHGGGGGGGDDDGGELPPVASITDGPDSITNETSASFAFVADQDDADFGCSLDGAVATSCSSPITFDGLVDGSHTFAVYATGGIMMVGPTATWTWTVDTTDPVILITSAPAARTTATTATFELVATDAAAVLCGLDGAPLDRCTSPVAYTALGLGIHTFTAAAIDAAGNFASVGHRWTVEEVASQPPVVETYMPITGSRLADTRPGASSSDGLFVGTGPVPAGQRVEVPVAGRFGIPVDADAVVVNVTITQPAGAGFATAFACGAVPGTSSLNYLAGQTVANEVIVPLSPTGSICVFTLSTAHVVVDANGYF